LNDWLTQLDTENQKFKALMSERYTEASQRLATRMKAARAETDKALRTIFGQIEALALVNGIAAYEAFIREVNAVLERYKNILAQEKGRRKANDKEKELSK
jgi:capsule polysaccharide export protein KpsE/RkpR